MGKINKSGITSFDDVSGKFIGLGLSKVEGSGIPGGEVKFIDTRRKADGEGISLALC